MRQIDLNCRIAAVGRNWMSHKIRYTFPERFLNVETHKEGKEEEEDFSRLLIQKIKNFNDQFFASEI